MPLLWMTSVDWTSIFNVCVSPVRFLLHITDLDFLFDPLLKPSLGTYGGHLELTAFAHLKKRDVKVIQPGLVYVIEWKSGADLSPTTETPPSEQIPVVPPSTLNEREVRKTRREKRKEIKERAKLVAQSTHEDDDEDEDSSLGAIYVACVLSNSWIFSRQVVLY